MAPGGHRLEPSDSSARWRLDAYQRARSVVRADKRHRHRLPLVGLRSCLVLFRFFHPATNSTAHPRYYRIATCRRGF